MKNAFHQGELEQQHVGDNDDEENAKIEATGPTSDSFRESVPELSQTMQLKLHQRVRLLKTVYDLVNAP